MSFILRCVFVPALLFLSLRAQAPYTIQTIVGEDFPDGLVATEVSLGQIGGLAVDGNGDLYIASAGKYRVFKVTKDGKITTFAKQPPNATFLESFFVLQGGIAFDSLGNLYVSCGFFGGIKKIDSTGKITNFYNQPPGYDFAPYALAADRFGNVFAVDQRASLVYKIDPNGSATSFRTNFQTNDLPTGIAVDKAGDVYLSDSNSHVIRRVSASGAVTVFAGTGEAGSSGDGGAATKAQLHTPEGLAIDLQGNLFIIDGGAIRKVDLSGIITTVYVNPVFFFDFIAVDISGNVYFCDSTTVYRMDPTGAVAVFAGNHSNSHSGDGGPAIAAQVDSPRGMLLDASGNLLLSDFEGSVRKVNSQGVITSVVTQAGYDPLTGEATPQSAASIAYDPAANLLVADTAGQRILSYTPSGVVSTIAGKAYVRGYAGDGGPATQALLERPDYVIFDPSGNLLISEQANHVIRKIDIGGTITTVAGTGIAGFSGDNGLATKAQLNNPRQIAVDSFGNIYIADSHNHRIRKVGPDGVITSVAGNGFFGTSGDGGPAISAALSAPSGVIVDSTGNLFIAQYRAVRQVDTAGIITTIAGGGTLQSVEGIPATDASLGALHNLLLGKSGQIYVSGFGVRVLTPGTAAVPLPQVTIDSSPQSLGFTISGDQCPVGTYVTPEYLTFPGSDSCTITFNQTYSAPRGGRYVFDSWVDGASATVQRTVVAPKGAATEYFARFQLRYPLTLSVQPAALAGRASIQTAPPSPDGFFNAATQVTITAKSPPGYTFTGFSGGLSGTQNGQTLNLNAATTVVANFAPHALPRGNAGVFRQGFLWLLDVDGNQRENVPADAVYAFGGIDGDIPIVGDWNGNGHGKIGIYRPLNGLFILDTNGNGQLDAGDQVFSFAGAGQVMGDVPVVGDWNGDGRTKVGLFRQGFLWILDYNGNGVLEANIDKVFGFGGIAGDVPVVGDWTGTGTSKVGIVRQGFLWILDANGNYAFDGTGPGQDLVFPYGGFQGDIPMVGDWSGTGVSQVGVYRQGFLWVLDANGNRQIDGGDFIFAYGGLGGDKPVAGKW